MPKKRLLSAQEQSRLRDILQSATIAALMDSRRWQPGELAFRGGTSLHLVHGSTRFSEDLDFMVRGSLSLDGLSKAVQRRLRLPLGIAADLRISVSSAKDAHNPHAFMVTLSGADVLGSAKVKVELWQTNDAVLNTLQLIVSSIPSEVSGQTYVPTLTLAEILADKVYALGARERVKPRDIFDLWWINQKEPTLVPDSSLLLTRLDIYPQESGRRLDTARSWLDNSQKTLGKLLLENACALVATDLKRWLPGAWRMDESVVQAMMTHAVNRLQDGIHIIQGWIDDEAQGSPDVDNCMHE